jgi:VIT1/CCC1 family predicted Fe2+/Mn2+ transporter
MTAGRSVGMPPSDWAKIISVSVVPVVIISSCGLLCLAFYNRLAAIVSRLRGFQRERLHEQDLLEHAGVQDGTQHSRRRRLLEHLETQTARVVRRAKLIRLTLLFLLLTISLLIGCCMMLGLSVVTPDAVFVAVSLFMLGLLTMLTGMIAAMLELKAALQPAELESRFVSDMLQQDTHRPGDAA